MEIIRTPLPPSAVSPKKLIIAAVAVVLVIGGIYLFKRGNNGNTSGDLPSAER